MRRPFDVLAFIWYGAVGCIIVVICATHCATQKGIEIVSFAREHVQNDSTDPIAVWIWIWKWKSHSIIIKKMMQVYKK